MASVLGQDDVQMDGPMWAVHPSAYGVQIDSSK